MDQHDRGNSQARILHPGFYFVQKTYPTPMVNMFSSWAAGDARVFRHFQVVENHADIARKLPHLLCNASRPFGFDEPNGKSSEPRHVFGSIAGADATSVLIVVPVEDVMTAVLDAPVGSVGGENTFFASAS